MPSGQEPVVPSKTLIVDIPQSMGRAEASFKKEERAREGAMAMRDYEAESRAVHEKTARLRALRLAKQAAG